MKRLLLAYGNELRGDDGAAWTLAEQSGWPAHCTVQLTPELVDLLPGLDVVVFADASRENGPARLRRLSPEVTGRWPVHCADPCHLLELCRTLYGQNPPAYLLTLPGVDFGYHLGLSPEARASVAEGLSLLTKIIADGKPAD